MSLEGLNSLIQLESTRLEGAKAVTQNFQSVGSTVQQQGIQTAQSKGNMAIQRIDAQYTKECSEADVRKLERRLARERASEGLSKSIAVMSFLGNAIGNFGHLVNDLKGRQKLEDSPEYLKTPPIDPTAKATTISVTSSADGNFTYASSGINKEGSETVYGYRTGKDGVSTSDLPVAANISEYDKERILGDGYAQLKAQNGGQPLNFAQIRQADPVMAEKLLQTRGHGVSQDEAANLMEVLDTKVSYNAVTSSQTPSQAQAAGITDAQRVAAIGFITGAGPMDEERIAGVQSIVNGMTPQQKAYVLPPGSPPLNAVLGNETLKNEFLDKLKKKDAFDTGAIYLSTKNKDGSENIQVNNNSGNKDSDKGLTFRLNNITAADKAKVNPKYEKMSFDEIVKDDPKAARKLIANVVEEKFKTLKPEEQAAIMASMGNPAPSPSTFAENFANMMESNPEKANEVIGKTGAGGRLQPLSLAQAGEAVRSAGLDKNLVDSRSALKENLGAQGKLDNRNLGEKAMDVGKALTNFLVNTVQDSVPYFQAYLKAKERADKTYEELVAAMDKLNAASKRLKSIEMQIDAFSGRGA